MLPSSLRSLSLAGIRMTCHGRLKLRQIEHLVVNEVLVRLDLDGIER
jgi:hypothetical protein